MNEKQLEDDIINALQVVIDPELGISVVDLGLIYGIEVNEVGGVQINITLTTPACPLTGTIEEQIQDAVMPLAKNVDINWVWNPPWTTDMITENGKKQLAAIGFNF